MNCKQQGGRIQAPATVHRLPALKENKMDSGHGNFIQDDLKELKKLQEQFCELKDNSIFTVGERVRLKSSQFRVSKITPKKITLRLLPSDG